VASRLPLVQDGERVPGDARGDRGPLGTMTEDLRAAAVVSMGRLRDPQSRPDRTFHAKLTRNKRQRPASYEIHQPGGLFEQAVERRRVAANRARLKAAKGRQHSQGQAIAVGGAA
jgi:hypothetical protein